MMTPDDRTSRQAKQNAQAELEEDDFAGYEDEESGGDFHHNRVMAGYKAAAHSK